MMSFFYIRVKIASEKTERDRQTDRHKQRDTDR